MHEVTSYTVVNKDYGYQNTKELRFTPYAAGTSNWSFFRELVNSRAIMPFDFDGKHTAEGKDYDCKYRVSFDVNDKNADVLIDLPSEGMTDKNFNTIVKTATKRIDESIGKFIEFSRMMIAFNKINGIKQL